MGMLPQTRCGVSLVEGSALHLRSEYSYPNEFLRVLLLTSRLMSWVPHGFAIEFGKRLGSSRLVWLLSAVLPYLGLPFPPGGFGASVVPPVLGRVGSSR